MGYCVSVNLGIRIPKEKVAATLVAVNAIPGKADRPTLKAAFVEWGVEGGLDENGDFVADYFTDEKWYDHDNLFETIAPFVADDGEVRVYGEDDEDWGYHYSHGRVLHMRRVWVTEPEIRDVITVKE